MLFVLSHTLKDPEYSSKEILTFLYTLVIYYRYTAGNSRMLAPCRIGTACDDNTGGELNGTTQRQK
jgi:hypothetical protein